MDRRTYEGHMDWEYQNQGPFDPTSPFTHAAKSGSLQYGFGSPTKNELSPRRNQPTTPSRFPQESRNTLFSSQQSWQAKAPPFTNPAFTTPRKPFDDHASGTEDSPALTETSDIPNDTPEADRMSDVNMGNTITPGKIDKAARYNKTGHVGRKHTPGKGEIMPHRNLNPAFRRRKHVERGFDSHGAQNNYEDSEFETDTYSSHHMGGRQRATRDGTIQTESSGGLFDIHNPDLPDILRKWLLLGVQTFLLGTFCYLVWGALSTMISDVSTMSETARAENMGKKDACQKLYTQNQCSTATAPQLIEFCDKWYECMTQSADFVYSRVIAVQISAIINEVVGIWSIKTTGVIVAGLLLWILAKWATGPGMSAKLPVPLKQNHSLPNTSTLAPDTTHFSIQTPKSRRYSPVEESDTDASPPVLRRVGYTPSGRGSPMKGERSRSPVKFAQGSAMRY